MSDSDVPAGKAGGLSNISEASEAPQLAERLRVHALAKLISTTSRQVLDTLAELGSPAKGAQSSIDRATALKVIESMRGRPSAEPSGQSGEAGGGQPAERAAGSAEADAVASPPTFEADRSSSSEARPGEPATESPVAESAPAGFASPPSSPGAPRTSARAGEEGPSGPLPRFAAPSPMFLPPDPAVARPAAALAEPEQASTVPGPGQASVTEEVSGTRRRRRRGRRGRGRGRGVEEELSTSAEKPTEAPAESSVEKSAEATSAEKLSEKPAEATGAEQQRLETEQSGEQSAGQEVQATEGTDLAAATGEQPTTTRRRRRRRRRRGSVDTELDTVETDDPPNTITKIRDPRPRTDNGDDGVQGVRGSTRLEAKRQRRRDGRDAGRRRAPVLSEAEFLARRESVERTMVVRQRGQRSEIGVLEDGVLVEHFVTSSGGTSLVGNVYLGRVQNVLPSMEAAFVDIGRGRNAVLYAGEVDWDAAGLAGKARRIEQALSSGDNILVQVTKDPVGHKGARLTTQISLPGRFLVYVPSGGNHGISRKLPDVERRRLKEMLKEIVPDDAGVIIRTASEGVSQEALERDVRRLQAQWEVVKSKAEAAIKAGKSRPPELLYEEPDLMIKVVRDLFNEDFSKLVVEGDEAWETLHAYVSHVAPELVDRLHRHVGTTDVFTEYRIDEQIAKALDRKVWLPSGGTLVIDRTEAMTVIDVNTGKFTGSGGNLEETVTRNNLEAAEEIVRQLRLRDIGGIIVIDFIDMVLESNRDLVLRRLTECLGRDRTRHQVAEVTSLGLVQMTRKRVGTGLLEAFSTPCEHCRGRGVLVSTDPVEHRNDHHHGNGGRRRGRGGDHDGGSNGQNGRRRGSAGAAPAGGFSAGGGEERSGEQAADQVASARHSQNGRSAPATDQAPAPKPRPEPRAEQAAASRSVLPASASPPATGPGKPGSNGPVPSASGAFSPKPSGLTAPAAASATAPASSARQPVEAVTSPTSATASAPTPTPASTPTSGQPTATVSSPREAEPSQATSRSVVSTGTARVEPARPARRRRRAASRPAGPPAPSTARETASSDPV